MIYTAMTKKAMKLAYEMHRDQTDKSGMPYIFHPFYLAEQMTTEETATVALLHDLEEDTDCTLRDLAEMGFPPAVTDALALLTHDPSVPYLDYVKKIRSNPTEKAVKLADLRHNSDFTRLDSVTDEDRRRAEKYRKAIEILTEEDGETGEGRKQFPPVRLQPVREPDEAEIARMIRKRDQTLLHMGFQKDEAGHFYKPEENIRYFRLTNGLLLKIDSDHLTCYRFDPERKEWNEDSVLFTEYEYGGLQGELVFFSDVYPIGEPFKF